MSEQPAAAKTRFSSPIPPNGGDDKSPARSGCGAVGGLLLVLVILPVRDAVRAAWRKFWKWIAL